MLSFHADDKYVAIDDIKLVDCAFPKQTGICNMMQTGCDNGACIHPDQVIHNFINHAKKSLKIQSESDFMLARISPSGFAIPYNFSISPIVVSISECRNVFSCGVYSTSST